VDPVCGMEIDPSEARHQLAVDGTTWWFCCQSCLDELQREHSYGAGSKRPVGTTRS